MKNLKVKTFWSVSLAKGPLVGEPSTVLGKQEVQRCLFLEYPGRTMAAVTQRSLHSAPDQMAIRESGTTARAS